MINTFSLNRVVNIFVKMAVSISHHSSFKPSGTAREKARARTRRTLKLYMCPAAAAPNVRFADIDVLPEPKRADNEPEPSPFFLLASPPLSLNLFHVEKRSIVECEKKGAQFEWISFILSFQRLYNVYFRRTRRESKKKAWK